MNTVKHSKDLKSLRLPKMQYHSLTRAIRNIIPTMVLAALIGTYLDLFFVGKGLYYFPERPLPHIFSIHITFTLFVLPVFTALFLIVSQKLNVLQKIGFITVISAFMTVVEKAAERYGFLVHHHSWQHYYSFFGYDLYLTFLYIFYIWTRCPPKY